MSAPEQQEDELLSINGLTAKRSELSRMDADLADYHRKRNRLSLLRARIPEIVHESAGPPDGMPRSSDVSDPTYRKAMRLIEECAERDEIAAWIDAVESVRRLFAPDQSAVADWFYFANRTERLKFDELRQQLNRSRAEIYRVRDEVLIELWYVLR